jgi:hypothetical protein
MVVGSCLSTIGRGCRRRSKRKRVRRTDPHARRTIQPNLTDEHEPALGLLLLDRCAHLHQARRERLRMGKVWEERDECVFVRGARGQYAPVVFLSRRRRVL